MNVNALSNIASPYIQSLTSAAMSALGSLRSLGTRGTSGTTAIPQDSSAQLSPFAQVMSALQQLQQSNPTQYGQVTQQIAKNLQAASQTAQANGNVSEAKELTTLSTDFQSASTNGQLPNIADLAQAMSGRHRHQYQIGQNSSTTSSTNSSTSTPASSSTSSTSTPSSTSTTAAGNQTQVAGGHHHGHHHGHSVQSAAATSSSATSTSATSSSSDAAQSLSQLLEAYANNAAGSNAALSPLNVIVSTLSSAGISLGS